MTRCVWHGGRLDVDALTRLRIVSPDGDLVCLSRATLAVLARSRAGTG